VDYYTLVDTCYTGIHNCIVAIEAYSGSEDRTIDLQNQIKKAEKISPDYQYRNLLVAAKYYEQGMYRATEKLAREILKERPDYLEVSKILGFALFELGKYEESKKYILEYLSANPRDMDSIIRLSEVYFHLSDYISSNLYLNNAVIAGYKPKTNLERRLAYNYSLLGDIVGMMKVMGYLLAESDATVDDFAVGISTALHEEQYTRALSWAESGLARFPDSREIAPLYIRSLRLD
jgi:tetratricopeptide (TPR) repeat protein